VAYGSIFSSGIEAISSLAVTLKSVAVGSEDFLRRTRQRIGIKIKGRKVVEKGGAYTLREPMSDYGLYSGPENSSIVPENRYLWDVL
jgi:hypothetical protein